MYSKRLFSCNPSLRAKIHLYKKDRWIMSNKWFVYYGNVTVLARPQNALDLFGHRSALSPDCPDNVATTAIVVTNMPYCCFVIASRRLGANFNIIVSQMITDLNAIAGFFVNDWDVAPTKSFDDFDHGADLVEVGWNRACEILEPRFVRQLWRRREEWYLVKNAYFTLCALHVWLFRV